MTTLPFNKKADTRPSARRLRTGILFVCMGNICRSPTAESVFREHAKRVGLLDGLLIESAGIGDWHVGQPPDQRAIVHARRRGYDLQALRARQVQREDFARFDWILAMDLRNLRDLKALKPPDYAGYLGLLLDFVPELGVREVPDPYFGAAEGFETVLELTERACAALLTHVQKKLGSR
jgi:protein-tyrosine phosphatase